MSGSLENRIAGGSVVAEFRGKPPKWISRLKIDFPGTEFILSELSLVEMKGTEPTEVSPLLVFGLNFTISRQALFDLGGFHPDLTPADLLRFRGDGETALADRLISLDRKALFHPDLTVRHVIGTERLNLKYLCRIWIRQGISDQFQAIRNASFDNSLNTITKAALVKSLGNKMIRIVRAPTAGRRGKPTDLLRQLCLTVGRLYLLGHFRKDSRVAKWVLRQDYFDYQYPVS